MPTYSPLPRYELASRLPSLRAPSMRLPSMMPSLQGDMGFDEEDDSDYGSSSWPAPNLPLSKTEEESLLNKTMGAVQYVGETLSKPGAAVRGLMGGQGVGALANLIPFSDTMGLTNAPEGKLSIFGTKPFTNKRIDFSDLLTQWGWESPTGNTAGDWGEWLGRGAVSLAGDVATDPLFWTNFGLAATTAKGIKKATAARGLLSSTLEKTPAELSLLENAKSVGKYAEVLAKIDAEKMATATKLADEGKLAVKTLSTPATLAEELRTGEKTLFGGRVPFSGTPILNTNLMPREWAAKLVETAGYSKWSPARYMRGLFSKSATGGLSGRGAGAVTFNGATQIMNDMMASSRNLVENSYRNIKPVYDKFYGDTQQMFSELAARFRSAGDNTSMSDMMRSLTDRYGVPTPEELGSEIQGIMSIPLNATADDLDRVAAVKSRLHDFMDTVHDMRESSRASANAWGANISELDDWYSEMGENGAKGYNPRRSTAAMKKAKEDRKKGGLGGMNPAMRRKEPVRNMPTGTILANNISTDGPAMGFKMVHKDAAAGKYTKETVGEFSVGQVVKAADRQNYGKVVGLTKDEALVHFVSPDGIEATVPLSLKVLSDAKNVPQADYEMLFRGPKLSDMTRTKVSKAEWTEMLRSELQRLDPMQDWSNIDDFDILRKSYINKKWVDPAIEKAWDKDKLVPALDDAGNAVLDEAGNPIVGVKYKKGMEGEAPEMLTYAAERNRWLGDGTATQDLAEYLDQFGSDIWEAGIFDRSYLADNLDYIRSNALREATMRGANHFLTKKGVLGNGVGTESWNSLGAAWKEAGFNRKGLENFIARNHRDQLSQLIDSGYKLPAAMDEIAENMKINPQAFGAMKAFSHVANPANENSLLKAYDAVNSYWKSMVYNIFPGGHNRDIVSTMFNQMAGGDVGPIEIARGYAKASKYLRDKSGSEMQHILEFIEMSGDTIPSQVLDVVGEETAKRFSGVPEAGFFQSVIAGPVKRAMAEKKIALHPLAAPGLDEWAKVPGKLNILQDVGSQFRQYQEFVQRAGMYDALKRQGLTPAEALYKVNKTSFDYSAGSKFEKDVMRRVVPFWGWLRSNTPYQLEQIVTRPGGLTGESMQTFTRMADARDEGVYTPSFLKEQMKFPLGNNPAAQSFYGNTVLPFNDLNVLTFTDNAPNKGRLIEKLGSQMNPLLTAPLEWLSGKQLATGRNIEDLESTTGALSEGYTGTRVESPVVDRIIHYSPFSRVASTAAQFVDDRKTWKDVAANLSGLGNVNTYDAEKWKIIDARNALEDMVTANPEVKTWKNFYVPNSAKEKMTPEEVDKLARAMRRRENFTQKLKEISKRKKLSQK